MDALTAACALQGALKGWVPLCEAIVSWHIIRCDGLRHDLMQLMHAFKSNLAKVRARAPLALCLSPAANVPAWPRLATALATRSLRFVAHRDLHTWHGSICRGISSQPSASRSQPAVLLPAGCAAETHCLRLQHGQWERHFSALQPAVRDKLAVMCQLQ